MAKGQQLVRPQFHKHIRKSYHTNFHLVNVLDSIILHFGAAVLVLLYNTSELSVSTHELNLKLKSALAQD